MRELVAPANRILCGPTRWSNAAVRHILGVPMRANCQNLLLMQWAHAKVVSPANRMLCWPMRESRTAVSPALDGPVRFNRPNLTYIHGPTR